jgi:hypothetical protein
MVPRCKTLTQVFIINMNDFIDRTAEKLIWNNEMSVFFDIEMGNFSLVEACENNDS